MKAETMQNEENTEAHNKRIAADLHDDLGSFLNGLKLSLSKMSSTQPDNLYLQKSTELLNQSMLRMRAITLDLSPHVFEDEGLHAAIESFVDRLSQLSVVNIQYAATFNETGLDKGKTMIIYRVVQELISNSIKHSGATLIEVGIAEKFRRLVVEVRDNGSGFDYETALKKKDSSGLKNIRSRLHLLSAILSVESEKVSGTHYFINIPISELKNGTNPND